MYFFSPSSPISLEMIVNSDISLSQCSSQFYSSPFSSSLSYSWPLISTHLQCLGLPPSVLSLSYPSSVHQLVSGTVIGRDPTRLLYVHVTVYMYIIMYIMCVCVYYCVFGLCVVDNLGVAIFEFLVGPLELILSDWALYLL